MSSVPEGRAAKPAALRDHLDPADRLVIARRAVEHHLDGLAGQLGRIELLHLQCRQPLLLLGGGARVDAVGHRVPGRIGQFRMQPGRVAAGPRGHLGREERRHDAVLVGGQVRPVAAQERCAGALLAGEAERALEQAVDEPLEAGRHLEQRAPRRCATRSMRRVLTTVLPTAALGLHCGRWRNR
jgi:hypothetical protein